MPKANKFQRFFIPSVLVFALAVTTFLSIRPFGAFETRRKAAEIPISNAVPGSRLFFVGPQQVHLGDRFSVDLVLNTTNDPYYTVSRVDAIVGLNQGSLIPIPINTTPSPVATGSGVLGVQIAQIEGGGGCPMMPTYSDTCGDFIQGPNGCPWVNAPDGTECSNRNNGTPGTCQSGTCTYRPTPTPIVPTVTPTQTPLPTGFCMESSTCADNQTCNGLTQKCEELICPHPMLGTCTYTKARNHACEIINVPDGTSCISGDLAGICKDGSCKVTPPTPTPTPTASPSCSPKGQNCGFLGNNCCPGLACTIPILGFFGQCVEPVPSIVTPPPSNYTGGVNFVNFTPGKIFDSYISNSGPTENNVKGISSSPINTSTDVPTTYPTIQCPPFPGCQILNTLQPINQCWVDQIKLCPPISQKPTPIPISAAPTSFPPPGSSNTFISGIKNYAVNPDGSFRGFSGKEVFATLNFVATRVGKVEVKLVYKNPSATDDTNILAYLTTKPAEGQTPQERLLSPPESFVIDVLPPAPPTTPISTSITPVECKTGVDTFSVSDPCDGGYRQYKYTCYDGKTSGEGSVPSPYCYSSDFWKQKAEQSCSGISSCPVTIAPFPTITPSLPTITTSGTRSSLSCTPSNGNYNVGDTFTVDLNLDTRSYPVYGADVVATYSPSQLEAMESSVLPITKATNWSSPVTDTIDQSLGKIRLDYGQNQPAFTGNATIGQVTFRVINPGQPQLNYVFFQQYDNTTVDGGTAKVWGTRDSAERINNLTDVTNCLYVTNQSGGPTPNSNSSILKLQLADPGQVIRAGDLFDVNVLVNTGGQKTLGADTFLSFDSSKISIDPSTVKNTNYYDTLQANNPQDKTTLQKLNNKLLISQWQSTDLAPKSSPNDEIISKISVKAQAEGSSTITFDCTLGTTDSNIWNTTQNDILRCPVEPLTVNILSPSALNPTPTGTLLLSITPIPVQITTQTVQTILTSLQNLIITIQNFFGIGPAATPTPTPTMIPPSPTPTAGIFPNSMPTNAPSPTPYILTDLCKQVQANIGKTNNSPDWTRVIQSDFNSDNIINGLDVILCMQSGR